MWLANAPKRVVNTWSAYWKLEPWGMPWHRHASWMQMLDSIYVICMQWFTGGKTKQTLRKFSDWMPGDWHHEEPQRKTDIVDQLNAFRRRYDGHNN